MPSFEEIFGLATYLKEIENLKINLRVNFNGVLLTALYFKNKSEEKERKDKFFNRNKEIIEEINKEINKFNLKLKEKYKFLPLKSLEIINLEYIKKIIYEHQGKDSTSRKYTLLQLNNCLLDFENSIKNFLDSFEIQLIPFKGRDVTDFLNEENGIMVKEAFDIYSIGYFGTAVFLMGKCLEKNITDFLKKNVNKNKIKYPLNEIEKCTFHQKINILKNETFISESDYSKIMSIKWERNIAVHPSKKEEIEKLMADSSGTITLCINQIINFQKKIEEVKSEAEIQEEKARELLGGTSGGGIPILYGKTPEENLELLKSYGGKRIEEMREKLRKEIEETK
ncbi:DUF4145 domain-containing protein [Candidatus Pacearchaeota archaeon]|nr:DUF4145 domain-containing protein [Candidatus Pacearchaeota archaeon]